MPKQVRKTNLDMFLVPFQKKGLENRSFRFEPKNSWLSFSRGSGPPLKSQKQDFRHFFGAKVFYSNGNVRFENYMHMKWSEEKFLKGIVGD